MIIPAQYAAGRDWAFPMALDWDRYPTLDEAWRYSARILGAIRTRLAEGGAPAGVECVAVSGSFGRMEAGPVSDVDLIVIVANDFGVDAARDALASVWKVLEPLRLGMPKPHGVFSTAACRAELLDPATRGQVDESIPVFGKRIQLLLDAQPVYGNEAHGSLLAATLDRYATDAGAPDADREWAYLLDDLIRYLRSMCVHYRWRRPDAGSWRISNLKLRFGRIMNHMGLVTLLGECDKQRGDKVAWLLRRLRLTPLERLASGYLAKDDAEFSKCAEAYAAGLAGLTDPKVRARLASQPGPEEDWTDHPDYRTLAAQADKLRRELVRFLLERRGDWSDRFFESLLVC